ncbi:AAA family ATPase [Sedimentisphaera salicampi]|uniref:AAA family ATPase n=1 Tax=Sedimentisphaera salicampi TaxID=1941349 RepID=UPI00137B1541|nr:AAA family ATPase [Sedimentisphaera salicampi]
MKIDRISLKNFRLASEVNLDFDKRLNVFVGVNGSGKSTVLDALSLALSWFVSKSKASKKTGQKIDETDIRFDEDRCSVSAYAQHNSKSFKWQINKSRKENLKNEISEINQLIASFQKEGSSPVVCYYPVERSITEKISGSLKPGVYPPEVIKSSLNGKADYNLLFNWIREREDLLNQKLAEAYRKHRNNPSQMEIEPDSQYEAVKKTIETFVPEVSNIKVERESHSAGGASLVMEKAGETLSFDQLSGGEKNLIALAGDIAMRLVNSAPESKNPLENEGIILIDEIDLHLHPSWQRTVIPNLIEAFPNCQFFISTHSPQVISNVRKTNQVFCLRQLEDGLESSHPVSTGKAPYGMSIDRVVELVMDDEARPKEISEKLSSVFRLIEWKKFDQAKSILNELKKDMPSEDPEIMRADTLIRMEEIRN